MDSKSADGDGTPYYTCPTTMLTNVDSSFRESQEAQIGHTDTTASQDDSSTVMENDIVNYEPPQKAQKVESSFLNSVVCATSESSQHLTEQKNPSNEEESQKPLSNSAEGHGKPVDSTVPHGGALDVSESHTPGDLSAVHMTTDAVKNNSISVNEKPVRLSRRILDSSSSEEDITEDSIIHSSNPITHGESTLKKLGSLSYNRHNPWKFDTGSPTAMCLTKYEAQGVYNQDGTFFKGCKWSPDGATLMTNSNDNRLRIFPLPGHLYQGDGLIQEKWEPALTIKESHLIYDYVWHPAMNSAQPHTCSILSTSRDAPIHMYNTVTGKLTATYKAHNHLDELASAYCLTVSPDGGTIYAGYKQMIRVFNVDRPGKFYRDRPTFLKEGQAGIISCIAVNPAMPSMYAAGSYRKQVAIYNEPQGNMEYMFEGQQGGVTHIEFSKDGKYLYTGGRKDAEILCWDLRNPGSLLYVMKRPVETNQRIQYQLDCSGRYLCSGDHYGDIRVWDMESEVDVEREGGDASMWPAYRFKAHTDTVNGVSFHPELPVLASACGRRHNRPMVPRQLSNSSSSDSDIDYETSEASVKLWWVESQILSS